MNLIIGHEGGKVAGIAPCFSAMHQGRVCLLLLGSIEISDYLDVITKDEDRPRFIQGLLEFIRSCPGALGGIEALDFYNILEDSPTIPVFESLRGRDDRRIAAFPLH